MIDKLDLDAAVRSGAISIHDADRLRRFAEIRRQASAADEEDVAFVGGFSDVMTCVALFLTVTGLLMAFRFSPMMLPLMAPLAWIAAEYVTRRRRLPLASGLLLVVFALSATSAFLFASILLPGGPSVRIAGGALTIARIPPLSLIFVACGTTMMCAAYWLRFKLPIAYAAAVMALLNLVVRVLQFLFPATSASMVAVLLLIGGVATLVLAIRWDMSDVYRQTRRADVAFWLHAMAGFQIAGASFRLILGLKDAPVGWNRLYTFAPAAATSTAAWSVLALFFMFILLALALDRRSILMSSLAFVVPAMMTVLRAGEGSVAVVILGVVLLVLSLRWSQVRLSVVEHLPVEIRAQLPRTRDVVAGPRPVL